MAELKPCPFCGSDAVMHYAEFISEYCSSDDKLPKDARIIREYRTATAVNAKEKSWTIEFRRRAYVPQCSDSSCVGRCTKMYKTAEDATAAWNRRKNDGT